MINPQQPNGYVTWDENIVTHKNTNSLPRLCFHSLTETFILNQTKESRLKFRYFMSALTIFQLGIRHIIPNSENEKKKQKAAKCICLNTVVWIFFILVTRFCPNNDFCKLRGLKDSV